EVINQWNLLDYSFPYDYDLINSYRPENSVFTGLEITDDRIFLAVPRLRTGVGATLATIPRHTPPGSSPALQAYPSWDFHRIAKGLNDSCDGLTSVYRIRKDSCNRLWVLDAGVLTSLEDFRRICPPKLVIFDLRTDQPVRTIIFPRQVLRPNSLLTNLILDETVQGTCDHAFVYMSDTAAPGLVVYDGSQDTAWRLMHPAMFPDPDFSDYTVQGEKFTLMDGVVGLALAPKLGNLYFQPLATDRLFSIPTSVLRKGPPAEGEELPITLAGKKSSQGLGLAVDTRDDTLFFSPVSETSIASWNPATNQQKLIAYDPEKLQFAAELMWHAEDNSVWLLSTRFQKFFRRTLSPSEVNFRLIRIHTSPVVSAGLTNTLYYK
ncbi:yellow-e, partial [Asbolus verrucosus]